VDAEFINATSKEAEWLRNLLHSRGIFAIQKNNSLCGREFLKESVPHALSLQTLFPFLVFFLLTPITPSVPSQAP